MSRGTDVGKARAQRGQLGQRAEGADAREQQRVGAFAGDRLR